MQGWREVEDFQSWEEKQKRLDARCVLRQVRADAKLTHSQMIARRMLGLLFVLAGLAGLIAIWLRR